MFGDSFLKYMFVQRGVSLIVIEDRVLTHTGEKSRTLAVSCFPCLLAVIKRGWVLGMCAIFFFKELQT